MCILFLFLLLKVYILFWWRFNISICENIKQNFITNTRIFCVRYLNIFTFHEFRSSLNLFLYRYYFRTYFNIVRYTNSDDDFINCKKTLNTFYNNRTLHSRKKNYCILYFEYSFINMCSSKLKYNFQIF